MKNPYLLWIVDAQNDFFDEVYEVYDWTSQRDWDAKTKRRIQKPALSVPESKFIRFNLGLLCKYASKNPDWCISGSLDTHTEQDHKHFSRWPIHCLKGYAGYFPITEIDDRDWYEINHPLVKVEMTKLTEAGLSHHLSHLNNVNPLFFEKGERPEDTDPNACNSCRVNPNVAPALEIIQPKIIVICGLALGYCVKEARDYFKELGYKVALVTDAIKEFSAEELALYGKWHAEGDTLVHISDVLEGKLRG